MKDNFLENCRDGDFKIGLLDLIDDLPFNITMLEIGCFKGESTSLFMDSGKIFKLYAVDVWRGSKFQRAEKEFDKRLAGKNIQKFRMNIIDVFSKLPMVDFVYIDGNHSYEHVKTDITYALRKIKKGGIISGHDYSTAYKGKVVKAVDELLGIPDKIYKDTSWLKYL